jgi:hypothetical protein
MGRITLHLHRQGDTLTDSQPGDGQACAWRFKPM